jgi:mono/diheme cytochrome c family protein
MAATRLQRISSPRTALGARSHDLAECISRQIATAPRSAQAAFAISLGDILAVGPSAPTALAALEPYCASILVTRTHFPDCPMRFLLSPSLAVRVALLFAVSTVAWPVSASAQQQRDQGRAATKAEYDGWRQYMSNCARCHGDDGVGGVMAPDLRKFVAADTVNQSSFHSTVNEGRIAKGMPQFKSVLHGGQIDAIYAYLRARAAGELPAGRPRQH